MISHTEKNGKLYLKYSNKTLAIVSKSVLLNFLNGEVEPTEERKVGKQRTKPNTKKVQSFVQKYFKEKEKFYGKKLPQTTTENSKEYRFFKEATKLAYDLDVSIGHYIKAQVDGLSFVNNGRGQFPRPNQLVGDNAVNRVLDYMRKNTVTREDIELSDRDTYIPLMDNTKYQNILKRIKKQTATLDEAYYALKLQQHWNGEASMDVEVYIELMEEDVSREN